MIDAEQYDLIPLNNQQISFSTDLLLLIQDKNLIMNIMCEICENIPYDPLVCKECDALFCTLCIKNWMLKDDTKCCKCKNKFEEGRINRKLRNILEESLIKCPNFLKGCEANIKVQFSKSHLEECVYTNRKAKCLGCNQIFETTIQKKEIIIHTDICEDILLQCNYCLLLFKRKSLELHSLFCEERPMQCEDCRLIMKFSKLKDHSRKECASEIISNYKKILSDTDLMLKRKKEKIHKLKHEIAEKDKLIANSYQNSKISRKYKMRRRLVINRSFKLNNKLNDSSQRRIKLSKIRKFEENTESSVDSPEVIKTIWNADHKYIQTLEEHKNSICSIIQMKWNLNETTLISGSKDKTIKLWNVKDGSLLTSINTHSDVRCLIQMKWSKDEITIVSGNKNIKLWNATNGELIRTLEGHSNIIHCLIQLKWCKDDTTIVSGSKDKKIKIWNAEDGVLIRTLVGHKSSVNCLIQMKWNKNDTTILSSSEDITIKEWNSADGTLIRTLCGPIYYVSCLIQMKWKVDYLTMVSGGLNNKINLWNVENGTVIRTLKGHDQKVNCIMQIKWSKDDTTIISGSSDRIIRVWNAADGILIRTLEGHHSHIFCLIQMKLSDNERTIVSGSYDQTIKIWIV